MGEVVKFPVAVDKSDVVGSLRELADWIENGVIDGCSRIVLVGADEGNTYLPWVFAYGAVENKAEMVYILELAKMNLLTQVDDG